jgi:ATP-binding cassette, subfamily B, bacterial
MRKYALWFFRQMSAVRGRLLLRIIAGLLQVALGLWLVWLCRRFIDVVIWRGNVLRETIVLFSVIALLIALRQLVFYLSGITEVILQNDMRSRLFRFVLGRKLYAVKHQAEAGSGKPASDMLSGDISQRLERDGNLGFKEHCLRKDVIAKAHAVICPDGSRKSLISQKALRNWHRW